MSHEIFIHIGLHKTGTTSLQSFFALNEAVLGDHGIRFPQATREAKSGQIIHSNLSWELRKHGMFNPQLGCFADLVEEIENSPFKEPCKWIISGEGLSRLPNPRPLLSAFKRWPVTVVAYVRDPVEAAPSLYTEHLKAGCCLSFDQWIDQKAVRWLNPKKALKPWREGAKSRRKPSFLERLTDRRPRQQFRFVERTMQTELLYKGSLIDDFMQLVDPEGKLPPLRMPEIERRNVRISALGCVSLLLVNSLYEQWPPESDQDAINQRNHARRAAGKLFPERQKPFEATPSQRARLKDLFRIHDATAADRPPVPAVDDEPIPPVLANWLESLIPDFATTKQRQQVLEQPLRFAREQAGVYPFEATGL